MDSNSFSRFDIVRLVDKRFYHICLGFWKGAEFMAFDAK
jgi:hypothetical protein